MVETTFVDLVTYRRDGTAVATPVLATPRNGAILIRTHATAGKLKRLRQNASVEVIPVEGHRRRLDWIVRGTARVLPEAETAECLTLLHQRHGLAGRGATWLRHLRGMQDVFIEVTPT